MFRRLFSRYGTFESAGSVAAPCLEESITSLEAQLLVLRQEQRKLRQDGGRTFLWEAGARPWALCVKAVVRVGQSVAALALVYWSMGLHREHLMPCDSRTLPRGSLFACEYTKAFLRVFTLLALNISLAVAIRIILQERIYYGMLRFGGLVDFADSAPLRDPLLWVLAVSLLHGLLHFVLKFCNSNAWRTDSLKDDLQEMQEVVQAFAAPAFVFMALFYSSFDIEATLIPLNKYFEEDWDYAKCTLGSIAPLDERILRHIFEEQDVVGELKEPTIHAAYSWLVHLHSEHKADLSPHYWFAELWPAKLLLDPRLTDRESRNFRCMFHVVLAVAGVVNATTLGVLASQAFKDIYYDAWLQGQPEDALSGAVILAHAVFLSCLLWKCVMRAELCQSSACCMARPKEPC